MKPAVALIVFGGLIILCTVVTAAIIHEMDKQRVAEFYQKNGPTVMLPTELRTQTISFVEFCGFVAGGVMVLIGIFRSRGATAASAHPLAAPDSAGAKPPQG